MSFDLLDPNMAVSGAGLELGAFCRAPWVSSDWAPRVRANLGPLREAKNPRENRITAKQRKTRFFPFLRDQDILI